VFIGPAIFGLLLGLNAQFGFSRKFLQLCRLNPVHHIPTAWDWKFGGPQPHWILVKLKDGTQFAGFCGGESFMSSDPKEGNYQVYVARAAL